MGAKCSIVEQKTSVEVPNQILLVINEALCSSCIVKPRKFHVWQENMMASAFSRGMLSQSPIQGFPRTSQ